MKEYRPHGIESPLPLAVLKDSFRIYFHEMEKLLPLEWIFEELEQSAFNGPENQFSLATIKDLL